MSKLARTVFALGAAIFAASAMGCSVVEWVDDELGLPPLSDAFDPGDRSKGDGYGSSGGVPGENGLTTKFVCPDELQACAHEFTLPDHGEQSVELRGDFGGNDTWVNGAPMDRLAGKWHVTVPVPVGKPVQYKFLLNKTQWIIDPAQPTVTDAASNTNNAFGGTTCDTPSCQDTYTVPPGVYDWRDSVIYFVFVDRFRDGGVGKCSVPGLSDIANYNGGDWPGVTQAINENYFTNLGVNTLWITVPLANSHDKGAGSDGHDYSGYHGYWPKVDSPNPAALTPESCFGTLDDLKAMVQAAHAKGIKILFDYAMVHAHITSTIYEQHQQDWFWPNDNGHGGNCICGDGCSWDVLPDRQRCWFTDYLPHWNYTNDQARSYSVTNAVEWAKQIGIDGFRLDAIKHVDISWLLTLRSQLTSQISAAQNPPQRFYLVGETYDFGDRNIIQSYVDPNTKLDGQFDFPLRAHLADSVLLRKAPLTDLASFMDSNDFFYGSRSVMSTFLGNHDLPRAIHLAQNNPIWGDQGSDGKDHAWSGQPGAPSEREAYERLANGFGVLFTNRGAPLLYYGDEIGMPGAGDPDNRRMMQWNGLSDNQKWLKDRIAALLAIRAAHPALRRGIRSTIKADADTWLFVQTTTAERVYVAINRGDADRDMSGLPSGNLKELVTNASVSGSTVHVPARQTRIFVQ